MWMSHSCSWDDMAGTSTPYPRSRTGRRVLSEGLGSGEIHLELDHDLVLELERAEEAGVRLDPEPGLGQGRAPPVPSRAGIGQLQPGRLGLAVEGDCALDGAGGDHSRRGEARGRAAQDSGDL